jgi:hypothetical protein
MIRGSVMTEERMLGDFINELARENKSGALYVSVVETSEDLIRIYFRGKIYISARTAGE